MADAADLSSFGRAAVYRGYAAELRIKAESAAEPIRRGFLDLANSWDALAKSVNPDVSGGDENVLDHPKAFCDR